MCVGRMTGYSVGFEGGRKGWTDWSLSAVECDSATPPVAGTTGPVQSTLTTQSGKQTRANNLIVLAGETMMSL